MRSKVLNHGDRLSFAGGNIYLFKYPKLRRTIQRMIEENNLEGSELTRKDQEQIANIGGKGKQQREQKSKQIVDDGV